MSDCIIYKVTATAVINVEIVQDAAVGKIKWT